MSDSRDRRAQNLNRTDLFMRLLMASHRKIYTYIFCLVPNWSDADDIMQEVTSVMLNKFDDFQEDSNFAAWGKKIALYEVFKFRRKQKRFPLLFNDEETIKTVTDYMEQKQNEIDIKLDLLRGCISELSSKDKEIIIMRYEQGSSNRSLAEKLGIHLSSVYRILERIHRVLILCVQRKMAIE